MKLESQARPDVSPELVDAIRSFPVRRTIQHCGTTFSASPFDIYADCPSCGARIKVRSFGGTTELEDVFDAVFEWMSDPAAREAVARRLQAIEADKDE
jgi:predicted  nucleic acid-binding Zn-ribbon protein